MKTIILKIDENAYNKILIYLTGKSKIKGALAGNLLIGIVETINMAGAQIPTLMVNADEEI
jgi:hypothetical protein